MKVRDLIDLLSNYDPDMDVSFRYPSGDYWRTQLTAGVCDAEETTVEWSEYHRQYALPRDEYKNRSDMERPKEVLLLKG